MFMRWIIATTTLVVIVGCGGGDDGRPEASDLAARIACTDVAVSTGGVMARESLTCTRYGESVTITTFNSTSQRDSVIDAFGDFMSGAPVIGDRWVITGLSPSAAADVAAALGGTLG